MAAPVCKFYLLVSMFNTRRKYVNIETADKFMSLVDRRSIYSDKP